MKTTYDFAVIGAGMAGASAAYFLSGHASVLILEQESQPGYHTTGRSAATFSEVYGNDVVRALSSASRGFLEAPPPGFGPSDLLTRRAMITVGSKDQLPAIDGLYDEIAAIAPSVRRLNAEQARYELPMMRPELLAGAVVEPWASDIDVHALHQGFLRGSRANGATLRCDALITRMSRHGATWVLETTTEAFEATTIINAAGAWGDQIAAAAGVKPVGLEPRRRTAVMLDVNTTECVDSWPLVIDVDEQFYFKPDAGRVLASLADETLSAPCDAQPEEIDVAIAIDRIETVANFGVRRLVSKWAGLRTFAPDRRPVLGYDNVEPSFFWLVGQGGYGIQTAPAMGQLASALALGRALPEHLASLEQLLPRMAPRRGWDG